MWQIAIQTPISHAPHDSKSRALQPAVARQKRLDNSTFNNCIGDDTKAVARQSLNCIKNKKNKIWRKTIVNIADGILTPCNVACDSGIVTVNSISGSTLQCDTRLWDDRPLNSPKRPPYWNSTSGFDFDHITAVDMSFCTSLWNFIQIGPPLAEKKWRHVDFQDGGSQPSWILGIQ